eukprot:CAMPEP_0171790682 /NCGR_PEP_ID=MMETSP0991-20121206/65868_1 /TAXON_ID=483369 /ORGANISM="non described non described, Strain CCMP2098" /LENGTH=215 /DNA_ID=CAMNT_0012400325 /DNA_START=62 /DNA_END=706 /DNA_ORIENTATION=+
MVVNACTVAVFIMGLNLGLTILLTILVAGHSPDASLDSPQMHQQSSFLRNTAIVHSTVPSKGESESRTMRLALLDETTPTILSGQVRESISNTAQADPCTTAKKANNSDQTLSQMETTKTLPEEKNTTHPVNPATTSTSLSVEALQARRHAAEVACRKKQCKVYYVHAHKSGGTTLCAIAGANGLRVNLATNCLQKNKGKPVPFWRWSTSQQRSW